MEQLKSKTSSRSASFRWSTRPDSPAPERRCYNPRPPRLAGGAPISSPSLHLRRRLSMRRTALLLFCLALISLAGASAEGARYSIPRKARQALDGLSAERIRAHLQFLSSDLLEGRGTGQRGGELAAAYIATQFELIGLQPG